jgi:hypothetical protein
MRLKRDKTRENARNIINIYLNILAEATKD